jgi:hypothetical protein
VGTVKKPSVFCEALFKLLWESALFADFHQQRQFPQALCSFFFATFFFLRASLSFSTETFRVRIAVCLILAFDPMSFTMIEKMPDLAGDVSGQVSQLCRRC